MSERRTIAALAYPGVQLLDIVGPLEAFNLASQQLLDDGDVREHAYSVTIIGKGGSVVKSMSGLTVQAGRGLDDPIDDVDTLLIPGALTGGNLFYESIWSRPATD